MSAISWIIEGLALVLLVLSIYLHFWGINVLRKYDIAGTKLQKLSIDLDNTFEIYKPALEDWKEKIDKNLEIPFGEHMFHAIYNTLVSLGASDMGKEGKAKQTMAMIAFKRIGEMMGKGLKKEIPAIEKFSGMAGGGEGGGGGGLMEMAASKIFGVDLPPGALDGLMGNMGGGGQSIQTDQKSKKAFE